MDLASLSVVDKTRNTVAGLRRISQVAPQPLRPGSSPSTTKKKTPTK